MSLADYLGLITVQHSDKPNYLSTVGNSVGAQVQAMAIIDSMVPLFDIDAAVGNQLDIIGQWVGIQRQITVPLSTNFFSFDSSDPTLGWDQGYWNDGHGIQVITLSDSQYRSLLYAKVGANSWDGTTESLYKIYTKAFPNFTLLVTDHEDLTYDLTIMGGVVDAVTLALLTGGYIPLRPEGIAIQSVFSSVDSNKVFGWDMASSYEGGWDQSSWAQSVTNF